MTVFEINFSERNKVELVLSEDGEIVFDEFLPWGTCPKCERPVLLGSSFCSGCGVEIVFASEQSS